MYRIGGNYPLIKTLNESVKEVSFEVAEQEREVKISVATTELIL